MELGSRRTKSKNEIGGSPKSRCTLGFKVRGGGDPIIIQEFNVVGSILGCPDFGKLPSREFRERERHSELETGTDAETPTERARTLNPP